MAEHRIAVGYDGSPESRQAVRWAAAVSRRRGEGLRVLSATGVDPDNPAVHRAGLAAGTRERAQTLAEEGAALAELPAADVAPHGVEGGAVAALVEASGDADLVVLGSRGRGRVRGVLLGSTAFSVAMHAQCPVAVVRGSDLELPAPARPIVVGTDGSPASEGAVAEAARLAGETGATLKIVVAYEAPTNAPWLVARFPEEITHPELPGAVGSSDPAPAEGSSRDQRRHEAAAVAHRAAEAATSAYDIDVELYVAPGRPERVIVEAAEEASLIVLGARGRGDFASLLLGSVSRDVIHHADCVVYIVR